MFFSVLHGIAINPQHLSWHKKKKKDFIASPIVLLDVCVIPLYPS